MNQVWMLGRFLEISLATDDIAGSFEFYRSLGFHSVPVGDVFSHPYAVMTDGTLFLGLHGAEFDSPALTYARSEIAHFVRDFEQHDIQFEFSETRDDEFNEAHLRSPEGVLLRFFESRTFSPPPFEYLQSSLCGYFSELQLPCKDFDASVNFWESFGFVCLERSEDPDPEATLTSDGLNIGLRDRSIIRRPVLVFLDPDMPGRLEAIRDKGMTLKTSQGDPDIHELVTPEGMRIWFISEDNV